jgi:hypothetical protein
MAIATLIWHDWLAPLRGLADWLASRPPRRGVARRQRPARAPEPAPATRRHAAPALRVVRVFEPSQPRAAAGRMVISGRMADVCAELDRLAAQEAARR